MSQTSAETKSDRKRISIPTADESTLAWWDAQGDPGLSVRLLIRAEIERNGYTDTAFRPVEQQPRRGRPPRFEGDTEGMGEDVHQEPAPVARPIARPARALAPVIAEPDPEPFVLEAPELAAPEPPVATPAPVAAPAPAPVKATPAPAKAAPAAPAPVAAAGYDIADLMNG